MFYTLHWHSTMLSWRFRKVFHVLFMWMILPSVYLVPDFQVCVERQLQKAIDRIVKWADSHGFKFSVSKTKAVLFHNKRKMVGVSSLNLYSELISSTDNVHFLGLVFDRFITWANHIQGLKESCKKPLEILKKTRVIFETDRAILHRVT